MVVFDQFLNLVLDEAIEFLRGHYFMSYWQSFMTVCLRAFMCVCMLMCLSESNCCVILRHQFKLSVIVSILIFLDMYPHSSCNPIIIIFQVAKLITVSVLIVASFIFIFSFINYSMHTYFQCLIFISGRTSWSLKRFIFILEFSFAARTPKFQLSICGTLSPNISKIPKHSHAYEPISDGCLDDT